MANALQFSNLVLSHNPFALGDLLEVSFSAKNVAGYKITHVNSFELLYGSTQIGHLDYPTTAVSWSNGKTRAFSGLAWNPDFPASARGNIAQIFSNPAVRAVTVKLHSAVYYTSGGQEYGLGDEIVAGTLMNKRYAPVINAFSVVRWAQTNPDESDKVRVTLDIDTADGTYFSGMTVRLYYSTGDVSTSSSYVDLTSQIATLVGAGETVIDLIQTFGTGDSWNFMLVFGDEYESATAYASVPNAFANMHLAGFSTGGVAFGKFSSSTQGNPLFECEYPAIFSDDIASPLGKLLKVVTVTASGTMSTSTTTMSKTKAVDAGAGWTPIGIIGTKASNSFCDIYRAQIDGDNVEMSCRYNGSSSGVSITLTADVLCLHTSLT